MKKRKTKLNITQIVCLAIVVALVLFMILPTIIGAFTVKAASPSSIATSAAVAQNSNASSKVTSSVSSNVTSSSSSNVSSKTASIAVPEKPNPPFAKGMAIFIGIVAVILMIITAVMINNNKKR